MKNLLMLLLFASVFAVNQLAAQSSCKPCPPDCCTSVCASTADGAAAGHADLAACCTPEQMKACSSKQKKANRKAGAAGSGDSKAAVANLSFVNLPGGQPAGNAKATCCSKQAALKEEL